MTAAPVPARRPAKVPKLPVPTEHQSQSAFFARVLLDPRTRDLPIYAVANGGHRHKAVAAKLKAEGVRAGVPDICVDVVRRRRGPSTSERQYPITTAGLRIEMKRPPKKPTPAQNEWAAKLRAHGYETAVCYSAAEAWTRLCDYLDIPEDPTR